jgi:hypothetical protein
MLGAICHAGSVDATITIGLNQVGVNLILMLGLVDAHDYSTTGKDGCTLTINDFFHVHHGCQQCSIVALTVWDVSIRHKAESGRGTLQQ